MTYFNFYINPSSHQATEALPHLILCFLNQLESPLGAGCISQQRALSMLRPKAPSQVPNPNPELLVCWCEPWKEVRSSLRYWLVTLNPVQSQLLVIL